MNDTAIIIIFTLLIAAIVVFSWRYIASRKNSKSDRAFANLDIEIPRDFPLSFTTPKGAVILAQVDFTPEHKPRALKNIDIGIDNLLNAQNAKYPHWPRMRSHADFVIMFINPARTNQNGSPALVTKSGVQTAGTVIGVGNDGYGAITLVLPHQNASNWAHGDYLMRSVWFEGEHAREWANDPNVFYQYTGANDSHPHTTLPSGVPEIPAENYFEAKGFVNFNASPSPFSCGLEAKK